MKKYLSIILLLTSICLLVGFSNKNTIYAEETTNNTITVVGYGIYNAEPDSKCITILSEVESSNLEEIKTTSENNITNIKNTLINNGINEQDISQCDTFVYKHCTSENNTIICTYKIAKYLTFITDIDTNIKSIITTLSEFGVNENYDERLVVRNIEENYNKALQIAVENAKEKAKNLSNKDLVIISIKESKPLPKFKNQPFKALNKSFNQNSIYAEVIVEFQEI